MSTPRLIVVNAAIAAYLLLTAALFLSGKEFWPVCTYWMYEGTLHRGTGHGTTVNFYTVANGQEKWVPFSSTHLLAWGYDLQTATAKLGWSSPRTQRFLLAALRELRHEARQDGQPAPTALRAYQEGIDFPASGDLRPVATDRRLLLQVEEPGT